MPLNFEQRAGVTVGGKPSYTVDQAAVQLDRAGVSWSALGQAATVTYAFRASAPVTLPDSVTGFSQFTPAQIDAATLSLAAWSDVANITFQRVGSGDTGASAYSNAATILFSDYSDGQDGAAAFTYLPSAAGRSASSIAGDVWVNITDADNLSPEPGSYGLQTLTHEIGHAIGLSHPSDYDAGATPSADPTYAADASYYEDSREYSVMSYFASTSTGGKASIFSVAPQLDDIAAAQRLYGANMSTRTGDDVYGFHSNLASDGGDRPWYELSSADDAFYAAIWDGGGDDTLDFSLYTQNQLIDLREGDFSNVGGDTGNLAIAVGAKIENAIGGSGDDTLQGNDLNNHLFGGAGNDLLIGGGGVDTLIGAGGADTLDGGSGDNTAVFAASAHSYVIALAAAAGTVTSAADANVSVLTSVQNVDFLDGVLTFDPTSTAAEIIRLYDAFLGRAPDTAGLNSYLNYIAAGHTLAEVAATAGSSAEFLSHTAQLSDAQFVDYVYETALHRHADAGGLQTYVADLQSGVFTRASLVLQAADSPEHIALTAPALNAGVWEPNETVEGLELLYDAAVSRPPDAYGLSGYGALIAKGETFAQIADQMAASSEFLASHGAQTDADYVNSLYLATVDRPADPFGLAAYTSELTQGADRGEVLYQIAMSVEHQTHVLAYIDPLLVSL